MRIALIGFGNVGRGVWELLAARRASLANDYGFEPLVTAIVARRGALIDPRGRPPGGEVAFEPHSLTYAEAIANADVVVELTPTDVRTGAPGLEHCRQALALGKHVVTANKGPLVVGYRQLAALARQHGVQFRFEGTVMGGTPSLVLGLETLSAAGIRSVRGIVNGTTNFILTQMEAGRTYAEALATAQRLGYAEADPAGDVEGWDAAAKAVILANTLLGADLRIGDVQRQGITQITADMIREAAGAGERWKLIAAVRREGERVTASVGPARVPASDPLALVGGGMNAITYSTETLGEVTLMGAGAGGAATAFAILTDLLRIHAAR